jgi:hypothetical protein
MTTVTPNKAWVAKKLYNITRKHDRLLPAWERSGVYIRDVMIKYADALIEECDLKIDMEEQTYKHTSITLPDIGTLQTRPSAFYDEEDGTVEIYFRFTLWKGSIGGGMPIRHWHINRHGKLAHHSEGDWTDKVAIIPVEEFKP